MYHLRSPYKRKASRRRKNGVLQTGQVVDLRSGEEIVIQDLILMIHEMTGSSLELQIGSLEYRPTEIWRMRDADKQAESLLGRTVLMNTLE
jgi:hypothetical protein